MRKLGILILASDKQNKALNPQDAEAYNNRGNAYDLKGNLDRVIADGERVLELGHDPTSKREIDS